MTDNDNWFSRLMGRAPAPDADQPQLPSAEQVALQEAQSVLQALEAELEQERREASALRERVDEVEARLAQAHRANAELSSTFEQVGIERDAAQREQSVAVQELKKTMDQLAAKRLQQSRDRERLREMEALAQAAERASTKGEKSLAEVRAQLEGSKRQLAEARASLRREAGARAEADAHRETLARELERAEARHVETMTRLFGPGGNALVDAALAPS